MTLSYSLLPQIARKSIENFLDTGKIEFTDGPQEKAGVFCTLKKNGSLRGCIGLPYPDRPLIESLVLAACSSCRDSRFPPLRKEELRDITIEISVLSEIKPLKNLEDIKIGVHGLIIDYMGHSGLLLPQVATEYGWAPKEFLEHICLKADLPIDAYRKAKLFTFTVKIYC